MTLAAVNITFDTTDPDKLAAWWADVLNGQVKPLAPGYFVSVEVADGPGLAFQKVDDPTPGKNRMHLDFGVADPDGNAFCVGAADHP